MSESVTTAKMSQICPKLPVIDLSGLEGPRRAQIGREILEACETWGFFHCINHGMDVSTTKAMRDSCVDFFNLPLEEKLKWTTSSATYDGYSNSKHKEGSGRNAALHYGSQYLFNVWDQDPLKNEEHEQWYPSSPPNYRPAVRAYFEATYALEKKLLAVLSEALGLESDALLKGAEGGAGETKLALHANFYVPHNSEDELAGIGLAPHTDTASMLTILYTDDVPGLEIVHENQWVKVEPVEGAIGVNAGDVLEVVTNGRLKGLEHRAVAHVTKERFSCALITYPQLEAKIAPIPQFIDEAHPAVFEARGWTWREMIAELGKMGLGYKIKDTLKIPNNEIIPQA